MLKKILENIGMAKKKAAKKKVTKKAAKKKVTKKAPAKKKVAKKVAKKKVAKKVAKKKVAKKVAKKKVAKKVVKKAAEKVVNKVTKKAAPNVEKKATEKAASKKEKAAEKEEVKKVLKEKIEENVQENSEELSVQDVFDAIRTLEFYKPETDECLARGCENPASTAGYCRYHYIAMWTEIKKKQKVLEEGKLQDFIESLVNKYPINFIESIITDLIDDKSFYEMLKDMDIDASEDSYSDAEDELDDDQDIAYETKVVSKPSFDD